MLQVLSDLFLLISNDGNKITNKDISTFYNFIIKKMPIIEQQYPSIIFNTLKISSENNSLEDNFKNSKDSKKYFMHFQKQIINLFNDLIDYCYREGIIKLNEKFEKLIKGKIDDKIKEKSDKKISSCNTKFSYNNFYQKDIYIKKAQKEEFRNFLIFLIINGDINFNIYPNNYVNFFNSDKKIKNRLNAEQLMKFIKNIIKIYKENKNKRTNNKNGNSTGKKNYKTEQKNNNKKKVKKNNKTDEKNKSTGIKSLNNDIKLDDLSCSNNKVNEKNIKKINSNVIENTVNSSKKNSLNQNRVLKKLTPLSDQSIIINDDSDNEEDEINDTIRCETPKNINKESENKLNTKLNLERMILNNNQENQRRYSANKKPKSNKSNSRLTISAIPSRTNNKLNKERNNSEYNSVRRFSYATNQKKNIIKRNKNSISPGEKYEKSHQSVIDENYMFNKIEKNNILKNKIKSINKSQNIVHKNMFGDHILNIEKIKKNQYCNESENNRIIKEKMNKFDYFNHEKYNIVTKISKDKNNNHFKELYLYDNYEVHQHLVIFNDKGKEEKKEEDYEDDIVCIIF